MLTWDKGVGSCLCRKYNPLHLHTVRLLLKEKVVCRHTCMFMEPVHVRDDDCNFDSEEEGDAYLVSCSKRLNILMGSLIEGLVQISFISKS